MACKKLDSSAFWLLRSGCWLAGWLAGWREVVGWLAAGWLETLNPEQSVKDVDGTNCKTLAS